MTKLALIVFLAVFSLDSFSMSEPDIQACFADKNNLSMVETQEKFEVAIDKFMDKLSPFLLIPLYAKVERFSYLEATRTCDDLEKIMIEATRDLEKAVVDQEKIEENLN